MTEHTVRSTVRLIAVVTILIGATLTTTTLISLIGVNSSIQGASQAFNVEATGVVAKMGFWAVMMYASIAAWGAGLYAWSPPLARRIVE